MKFADYIPLAMRTCKELPPEEHVMHMALGIAGEMGEIIDALKKHHIYGKILDQANIVEEVGDVAYYVAGLLSMTPELLETLEDGQLTVDLETLATAQQHTLHSVLSLNLGFATILEDIVDPIDEGFVDHVEGCVHTLHALVLLLNIDLEQALDINIAKLAKRYGDKYSDYNAINRDLTAERKILEEGV